MNPSIFDSLKRRTVFNAKSNQQIPVLFQMDFNESGAFLRVVNQSGKPVEADFRHYTGAIRDTLKSLDVLGEHSDFFIDWEKNDSRVYLKHNEFVLHHARATNAVVDANLKPITFSEHRATVVVAVNERDETMLEATVAILADGQSLTNFQPISDKFIFCDGVVYESEPLGDYADLLPKFASVFPKNRLEEYFTLIFSYFDFVHINYGDFHVRAGEDRELKPTLFFEKVDAENNLYFRVSQTLPDFSPTFFDEYDIRRIASLNSLEQMIVVSNVSSADLHSLVADVESQLSGIAIMFDKNKHGFYVENNLFILGEKLAREFILRLFPTLMAQFMIYGAEKLRAYKIRSIAPKLSLKLSSGIDFLEGEATLDFEGESVSLFDAITQFRKNNYVKLSDGTHALVNDAYIAKLERLFRKQKEGIKISFFDLPIVEELIEERVASGAIARSREVFLGFGTLDKAKTSLPKVNARLRPYQKQGFKWLEYLHKNSLGGCLADDMGLGKTLQAITLLSSVYPKNSQPSLIVMPRSLLFNWANEIEKFNPAISFAIYHGTDRDFDKVKDKNLILTTYATMRNDIEMLKEHKFYYVILDESQNIKNLESQSSKAVMLLNSKHRLALSGTPVENNLGELYSMFRFLNPGMFGTAEDFTRFYAHPIQRDNDKDAIQELKKKIYPFILRRTKKDVLKDLPDKVEQAIFVDMSPEQKKFYEQRRLFYYSALKMQIAESGIKRSQFYILQALSELRQIASVPEAVSDGQITSAKRELLMEQVSDAVANGHKVLIFANFLSAVESISRDLASAQIQHLVMTGATQDRQALVDKFQSEDDCKVFILTLKTGGLGLNLTSADYIFIYDPWWNKAAENQAIDRAHRIGQQRAVFSYKLIARDTIEEKMVQLQQIKSELFEAIISSDDASIKSLTEEDVEFILG